MSLSRTADGEERVSYKVLILGTMAVGKSSIVNVLAHGRFDYNYRSTIGLHLTPLKAQINGTDAEIMLFDIGGQERFKTSAPVLYRDAHAALLVCDTTSEASVEELVYWQAEVVKHCGSGLPVYILVNKIDLYEPDAELVETAMMHVGADGWLPTSAKTGSGIDEILPTLEQMLCRVTVKTQEHHLVSDTSEDEGPACVC